MDKGLKLVVAIRTAIDLYILTVPQFRGKEMLHLPRLASFAAAP